MKQSHLNLNFMGPRKSIGLLYNQSTFHNLSWLKFFLPDLQGLDCTLSKKVQIIIET